MALSMRRLAEQQRLHTERLCLQAGHLCAWLVDLSSQYTGRTCLTRVVYCVFLGDTTAVGSAQDRKSGHKEVNSALCAFGLHHRVIRTTLVRIESHLVLVPFSGGFVGHHRSFITET